MLFENLKNHKKNTKESYKNINYYFLVLQKSFKQLFIIFLLEKFIKRIKKQTTLMLLIYLNNYFYMLFDF